MNKYEIEVKSLLGGEEEANRLRSLLKSDKKVKLLSKSSQLNHYFNVPEDLNTLYKAILPHIPVVKAPAFQQVLQDGKNVSIRTRKADETVYFIVKASINKDSSQNGVSRIEFESETENLNLMELDAILLDAGLTYQSKWSREREEYLLDEIHVCIDKNAGYGYLAEFEIVVDDISKIKKAKNKILSLMNKLQFSELPQERIERMFAHYSKHWSDYYGTEKTFVIK